MIENEIEAIKKKYRNPNILQEAVENIADYYADVYINNNFEFPVVKEIKSRSFKMANKIQELENVLLDQIEKLSDDSLFENKESANVVLEKSKAISFLSSNFVELQQLKLNIVKTVSNSRNKSFNNFLGIEEKTEDV